jgi:mRNA interferase HigB
VEILGRKILEDFARDHADIRSAVDAWVAEVEAAAWNGPDDIRKRYASASFIANNRVVFDIRGNSYRLDVKVAYQTKKVLIKRIGTHAEYDRWKF